MGLPTKKHTRSQRDKRRAHLFLDPKEVHECAKCHSPVIPHHACATCGTYRGRQVIEMKNA